jgi:hypothetical protein
MRERERESERERRGQEASVPKKVQTDFNSVRWKRVRTGGRKRKRERERERERERVRERERERKIGSRQQAKFGEQIRVVVSDGPFIPVVVGKQETKEHRK